MENNKGSDLSTQSLAAGDQLSYDPDALSTKPGSLNAVVQGGTSGGDLPNGFRHMLNRLMIVAVAVFLLGGGAIAIFASRGGNKPSSSIAGGQTNTVEIPLTGLNTGDISQAGARSVAINGPLTLNDAFVLTPQAQPVQAVAGQMYFDQSTNKLNYYNGTQFVSLTAGLQSINSSNQLLSVSNDGDGNITLTAVSATGANSGLTTSGGTAGSIAKFTGSKNLENSLLSESGTTLTLNGNLTVTGSVGLGTPLSVANGGIGANTVALNGVVIGNGTGALSAVTAGGVGQCLLSTAGAPAFQACPGGVGSAFVQDGNSFGTTAVLGTNDGFGLSFEVNTTTVATISTIGAVNFKNQTDSINALRVQNAVGSTIFNIDSTNRRVGVGGTANLSIFEVQGGDAAVYNNGGNPKLILGDSTAGGQNGFVMWDSANDYLRVETTGTNGLKINDNFLTIGNIFPDQPLKVANGSTLLAQVSTTGSALFQNSANSTTGFNVKNAVGGNIFTVDTSNSKIGINLGGNNVPTMVGQGVQLQGSVRLTGTGAGGILDEYTTPLGNTVSGRFSIVNNDLPAFAQSVVLGVTAGSDTKSRGISLMDARAGRHDPTLAVFSTSENDSVGFNWNGSASVAFVQTSDNTAGSGTTAITLQSGDVSGGGTSGSGAVFVSSGSLSNNSSTSGNIFVVSGSGSGTNNSTGNVVIDSGNKTGSGTAGVLNIGITNASSINIGRSGFYTTNAGGLSIGTLGTADTTTILCRNTLNQVSTCASGAGNVFVQGGNTFGVAADLGTNDSFDLNLRRGGTTQLTVGNGAITLATGVVLQGTSGSGSNVAGSNLAIAGGQSTGSAVGGDINFRVSKAGAGGSSLNPLNTVLTLNALDGSALFKNATDTNGAFAVQTTLGNNVMVVSTSGARVGIGAAAVTTLGNSASGLNVTGAIRIGGTSDIYDTYTTPLGTGIDARLSIVNADVVNFDQIVALGVTAASSANARGITVADARTVTHQPTIAVLTPDESNIGGFSWDGSNTAFRVKNTSGSGTVELNVAGTTRLTAGTGGVDVTGSLGISSLGTANTSTYLCRNSSNIVATCTASGAGVAFVQGGNSFGATATLGTTDTNDLNIIRNSATKVTVGASAVTLASNINLFLQGATAVISNPQGTTNSEIFGNGATATGDRSVVVGNSATVGANSDSVAIGYLASAADDSTVIGGQANCTNNNCVAIGRSAVAGFTSVALGTTASANNNAAIAIGDGATTGAHVSIALGAGATTTASNQMVIGSSSAAINQLVVGNGVTNATPVGFALQASSGSGSNIAGGSLTLAAGQSTGNANGGNINFQVSAPGGSGSSQNSLSTVATISGANGAATFQNAANSTDALRVLNASSGEVLGASTSESILRLLANNSANLSGNGANWNTATSLPAARGGNASVAVNGYLYNFGGCDGGGSAQTTTYFTRIKSDGSLDTWTNTGVAALPAAMCGGSAATYNGYIYVHGGGATAGISKDVYYTKPGPDGKISAWATIDDPSGLVDHNNEGMVASNGYLYVTGGNLNAGTTLDSVYYAKINADGSLGSFTQVDDWLDNSTAHNPGNAVIANGYLYVLGSANWDKIYYGKIDPSTGSPGTTGTLAANTMNSARKYAGLAVMNGYLYVVAGTTSASTSYEYAPLNYNGSIGTFTQVTSFSLPASRTIGPLAAPVYNNYIYWVGGGDNTFTAQTSVYYAGGTRIKAGASLDLVGYSGEGMSEGSSGGQLTAGNTAVNGTLSVTGNTILKDGLAINGAVNLTGTASFQTTTNTTTAFQVLNASGLPQFVIDTTNGRVYIGNPGDDGTGALLVLDTKDSAGDPTGVAGGMYYNSSIAAMRCFQDGFWRDCITDSPRSGYHAFSDLTGINSTSTNDFNITVDSENGGFLGNINGESNHPGIVRSTATNNTETAGFISPFLVDSYLLGNGTTWRYDTMLRIPTLSDGTDTFIVRAGFNDDSHYPGNDGDDACFFKYSHNINSGKWQGLCADAGSSTCDTGITVAAGTWYRLTVVVNSAGTSADFQINGTSACTVSSQIPITTNNEVGFTQYIQKTAGTNARTLDSDYIEILGQFDSPR